MSGLTPIASRLSITLDDEVRRMQNEWFFKWHFIGKDGPVDIDSFDGRKIHYGGIKFSGTAQDVYWQTIQRYLRKKISSIFHALEEELPNYPVEVRERAISEAQALVASFASRIRRITVEKDRILRGDGINFPPERDRGSWEGAGQREIEALAANLREIYCQRTISVGGADMPFQQAMNDKLTLVKKSGDVSKKYFPGLVSSSSEIITFEKDLPIQPGDHLLRELDSGLVDDFEVVDPGFMAGIGGIPPHFQVKVRRTDLQKEERQTVVQHIHNEFHGANARVNINSTDNSINVAAAISRDDIVAFIDQLRSAMPDLPAARQDEIKSLLEVLDEEIAKPEPSQSRVREALQTIRSIAEGITGSLIATGIVATVARILGS